MEFFFLSALWILWCFLHSFLVSIRTTAWFKKRLGDKFAFYRLCYNLFSIVTVLPLLYWQHIIPGPIVIPLSPYLMIFKHIALVFSVIVIVWSFFTFDIWKFSGIRQIADRRKMNEGRGMRNDGRNTMDEGRKTNTEDKAVIKKHGFYGVVRHPMYLGGAMFFTAYMMNVPLARFLGSFILAVYMIIGTVMEDRRLAGELGDEYRDYQKEVPMLFPEILKKRI